MGRFTTLPGKPQPCYRRENRNLCGCRRGGGCQAIHSAVEAFRAESGADDRRLRARAINEMADRFEAQRDDLIEILSLENGKVKAEARFEVEMVPHKLRFYAALALTDFGRAMETSPGRYTTVLREPIGVAGIIAPVELAHRAVHPQPRARARRRLHRRRQAARATAQTNARMCEVFSEVASLPTGVLNVFTELQQRGARALVASPDVPTISLTGSSKTGQQIMAAGAANMKRFGGELGGKTPILLFDDADLERALPMVEKALTVFAGQFCMTGSRLLVHRPILDRSASVSRKRLGGGQGRPGVRPVQRHGPDDQQGEC